MKDKILALLMAKFSGVRKDALAQLAGALSLQAATEDEAKALVEKLAADQVTEFVKEFRKDVDKEIAEATKTHESNLKKKFDFKAKETQDPDPSKGDPKPGDDIAAQIKAAVTEAVKPLHDKLAGIEGDKVKTTRQQKLEEKLKDVPESFKTQKLKDFNRMTFADDTEFDAYLTETETNVAAFNQELADKGLRQQAKPVIGGKNVDGVSKAVTDFIKDQSAKEKPLTGKVV